MSLVQSWAIHPATQLYHYHLGRLWLRADRGRRNMIPCRSLFGQWGRISPSARDSPIIERRRWVMPAPGMIPRRVFERLTGAAVEKIRTCVAWASSKLLPWASPATNEMVGTLSSEDLKVERRAVRNYILLSIEHDIRRVIENRWRQNDC